MRVITENEARTTTTPNGSMTTLAAPTLGSTELSSWRVRMAPGASGPVHAVDREQVFVPLSGAFAITVDGRTATVTPGTSAVLPAGVQRQVAVADGPAEALVCMPAGGRVTVPGQDGARPLPWAE